MLVRQAARSHLRSTWGKPQVHSCVKGGTGHSTGRDKGLKGELRYLQVFDVIQSSKFSVKFCDAVTDFFYLQGGRGGALLSCPSLPVTLTQEGGRGGQPARVLAGREGRTFGLRA